MQNAGSWPLPCNVSHVTKWLATLWIIIPPGAVMLQVNHQIEVVVMLVMWNIRRCYVTKLPVLYMWFLQARCGLHCTIINNNQNQSKSLTVKSGNQVIRDVACSALHVVCSERKQASVKNVYLRKVPTIVCVPTAKFLYAIIPHFCFVKFPSFKLYLVGRRFNRKAMYWVLFTAIFKVKPASTKQCGFYKPVKMYCFT